MNVEDAEEYTASLGQIGGGMWRQILWAERQGIPEALGMSTREWVTGRVGGYMRLPIPERREAVAELVAEGLTQREVAEVLGVHEATVSRDAERLAPASETVDMQGKDTEPLAPASAGLTPEQVAEHQRLAEIARWKRDGIAAADRIRTFLNGDVATVMGAIELGEDIDRIELCDVLLNAADALKGAFHE